MIIHLPMPGQALKLVRLGLLRMKFKVGDYVSFIDERREGYVTSIISEELVGVTDEDGFEIPVAVTNLTAVHGGAKNLNSNAAQGNKVSEAVTNNGEEDIAPAKPVLDTNSFIPGLYIAVTTARQMPDVAHMHLVNHTVQTVLYSVAARNQNADTGISCGALAPNGVQLIETARLNNMDAWPTYLFQAIHHPGAKVAPQKPEVLLKRFNAKDFATSKQQLADGTPAWILPLNQPVVVDAAELRQQMLQPKVVGYHVPRPKPEIDLHIEKLEPDFSKLNATQIQNLQLNYVQQNIDAAIANNMGQIIFIHGLGNGSLKKALYKLLQGSAVVKSFTDADNLKYGYGATVVHFR